MRAREVVDQWHITTVMLYQRRKVILTNALGQWLRAISSSMWERWQAHVKTRSMFGFLQKRVVDGAWSMLQLHEVCGDAWTKWMNLVRFRTQKAKMSFILGVRWTKKSPVSRALLKLSQHALSQRRIKAVEKKQIHTTLIRHLVTSMKTWLESTLLHKRQSHIHQRASLRLRSGLLLRTCEGWKSSVCKTQRI